jgi:hypothetical protein
VAAVNAPHGTFHYLSPTVIGKDCDTCALAFKVAQGCIQLEELSDE